MSEGKYPETSRNFCVADVPVLSRLESVVVLIYPGSSVAVVMGLTMRNDFEQL